MGRDRSRLRGFAVWRLCRAGATRAIGATALAAWMAGTDDHRMNVRATSAASGSGSAGAPDGADGASALVDRFADDGVGGGSTEANDHATTFRIAVLNLKITFKLSEGNNNRPGSPGRGE